MPHQCTSCGRTFPDGSKEMLSGCPDCGGNKFQFKPAGATEEASSGGDGAGSTGEAADPSPPTPEDRPAPTPDEGAADQTPSDPPDATPDDAASADSAAKADGTEQIADRSDEDTAQASARSEVVSPDELDRASRDVDPAETPAAEEAPEPGIDALRDELNDQFESIRIVSPGQYELNLMELYDRQEYIISLQEDGRYVIEMPDAWGIQDE
ncbi:OapC/ArvC family zinc-ribbon domain-containing protein [Halorubrum xinjiangense]|uniref:OapC/ArvC family zinc-ribbon domain-containing protein n=1 Tax=Halorubrum xinjiangense TaxID=261291 RepID=UPI003C6F70CD